MQFRDDHICLNRCLLVKYEVFKNPLGRDSHVSTHEKRRRKVAVILELDIGLRSGMPG